MIPIPSTVLRPPPPAVYAPGRPVQASTAVSLTAGVNSLIGWRALRSHVLPVQRDPALADHSDNVGEIHPWRWRWRPSSAASAVALQVWYLAEARKTGSPAITAELLDADGDSLDGPIMWSVANNYLPRSDGFIDANDDGIPDNDLDEDGVPDDEVVRLRSRDTLVTTGWSERGVADYPRMLVLPAPLARGPLQIEVLAEAVRVRSVTVIEAYRVGIP